MLPCSMLCQDPGHTTCIYTSCSRHNDQPFSKFAFLAGKYDQWDMANLTLTNTRDFAMFMALDSAGVGMNKTVALEKFKQVLRGKSVAEYCATVKNP